MSTNIPTSLVTRSVSSLPMLSLTRQPSSIDPQSVPEMLAHPLDVWRVIDQSYNDECDAEYLTQQQKCVTRMSSVNYDNNILNVNNGHGIRNEEKMVSHKIKRETIDDYCFGMTFTESFVPPASSVLNRPLPVPGTPQDENYRFDLPLRRLEPPAGTIQHKYMYDAVSALLEKTRSLLKSSQVQDNAETNTLCQNVQQILDNWNGFDVTPHDSSKVNTETHCGVIDQEYDVAFYEDGTHLYVEDREYENDDDDDDGFQEQTDYEKENEGELYMWGGLK